MLCAEPRFNFSSTPNVMAICNTPVTTMVPHRTQFLLLAALLIPTIVCAADFTAPVVSALDGDTLEVLRNNHAKRIRLSGTPYLYPQLAVARLKCLQGIHRMPGTTTESYIKNLK